MGQASDARQPPVRYRIEFRGGGEPLRTFHDMARAAYFRVNQHWAAGARQGVQYAMSIARRYSEKGDHDMSPAALNAVVAINGAYIEAKGKTFFANNPFIANPLTTDGSSTIRWSLAPIHESCGFAER